MRYLVVDVTEGKATSRLVCDADAVERLAPEHRACLLLRAFDAAVEQLDGFQVDEKLAELDKPDEKNTQLALPPPGPLFNGL